MSNTDNNLLIMTFYIIGLSYTFNRMIDSIDDKITFVLNKGTVDNKLKEYDIASAVGVNLKFQAFYGLDDLKDLTVIIENKSEDKGVYVDWDNCSIVSSHSKSPRRVIRKSPDVTRDLGIPQSPSLITPKTSLFQAIAAEDGFSFDKEKNTYNNPKPLIDITGGGLKKSPVKAMRLLYKDFMSCRKTLEFTFHLVLRVSDFRVGLVPGENRPPMYLIDCPVTITKLPWTYAMPWNKRR